MLQVLAWELVLRFGRQVLQGGIGSNVKLGKLVKCSLFYLLNYLSFCSEIGLTTFNKIRTSGDHESSKSEGCSAEDHGGRRWKDGIPSEARHCPGVHKAKSLVFRMKLMNGWERISDDIYFDCK